jgi:hypothetical protein
MAALPLPCALWFLDRVKGRDGCGHEPYLQDSFRPESSTWRQPGRQETRCLFGSMDANSKRAPSMGRNGAGSAYS